MQDWRIFKGNREPHDDILRLPGPPPWRPARATAPVTDRVVPEDTALSPRVLHNGKTYQSTDEIVDVVNAALYLRRPLLVTGDPGSGKSTLLDAIAYELRLGEPLRWSVTSRSTLRDALYLYDAVGRLQDQKTTAPPQTSVAPYLRLGPLGSALVPTKRPRALLIDEIDKADIDLPNDMLNVLEEGRFEIPELARLAETRVPVRLHGNSDETYDVIRGQVEMHQFPVVVMTSNGEREFPQAFVRRSLRIDLPNPSLDSLRLRAMVESHLKRHLASEELKEVEASIAAFVKRAASGEPLATDQLLNAVFLITGRHLSGDQRKREVLDQVTRRLD